MNRPRLLTPDDAEMYCAFRRAALIESPWAFMSSPDDDVAKSAAIIRERLRDPENVIVAVTDETNGASLLAAGGVKREDKRKAHHRAFIWGVYCLPAERGKGYGRAVMERAIEVARGWTGVERIGLSVTDYQPTAVNLYRALGFKEWGREPDALLVNGRRYDEIHMSLRVDGC